MKKYKIIIIILCFIIVLICIDFIALSFNGSPIIKVRKYYNDGYTIYIDKGLFTNTYKCYDGKTKTVVKKVKYTCPKKEIKEEIKENIIVTFDTKGGSKIDNIIINKNSKLTLPEEPTLEGYTFKGWVDKNNTPFYNNSIIKENTTLYATWEKINDEIIDTENNNNSSINNNNNINDKINTNKPSNNGKINTNNNETIIVPEENKPVIEKTLAEKNDDLRNQIQNKYSIKIAYKDELGNYTINGYGSEKLNDDNIINEYLNEIDKALKKYPNNFFKEMKDYGMPLTIYLVKNISGNVSGLTDAKDNSNIKIMIEPALLFENTLHHEIMHYIDIYIKIKGYPIDINNTMKEVNPIDFTYGDTSNNYVYYYSNLNNSYFISAYSKTNYLEDRAVIFSDLMSRSIAKDYYNDGTPINKKAKLISSQIKEYFNILSSEEKYYWDRFL